MSEQLVRGRRTPNGKLSSRYHLRVNRELKGFRVCEQRVPTPVKNVAISALNGAP
jgi:hypothetical protein